MARILFHRLGEPCGHEPAESSGRTLYRSIEFHLTEPVPAVLEQLIHGPPGSFFLGAAPQEEEDPGRSDSERKIRGEFLLDVSTLVRPVCGVTGLDVEGRGTFPLGNHIKTAEKVSRLIPDERASHLNFVPRERLKARRR